MTEAQKFRSTFKYGCGMWTSEDGTLLSIAIENQNGWKEILLREFDFIFSKEEFDEKQVKNRFAEQEWAGSEYFDGNSGKRGGKVWRLVDKQTPYPVIEYELKIPR